jgi:hypothetical protein
MTEITGAARADFGAALAAFDEIGLGADERLSAVASAVASAAARQEAAPDRFLRLLQDLTRLGAGGIVRNGSPGVPRPERIAEGAALLARAFERLTAGLAAAAMPRAETQLVEAVLLARLLAEFRPHAIRLALAAVGRAVADPAYRSGAPVTVPAPQAAAPAA